MNNRMLKDLLCDQVAREGNALAIDHLGLRPIDTLMHPCLVPRKTP